MSEHDNPVTGETLMGQFRRFGRAMARARHHDGHANHAQAHILATLMEQNPMTQRELMDVLGVRSASLSEILAKLERGGLVSRERDERDRRGVVVELKDAGREEIERLMRDRRERADAMFDALTDEERDQLHTLLGKVAERLEANFGPDAPDRDGHGHGGHHHHHGHGHGPGGRCRHGGHQHGDTGDHEDEDHPCGHGEEHGPHDAPRRHESSPHEHECHGRGGYGRGHRHDGRGPHGRD